MPTCDRPIEQWTWVWFMGCECLLSKIMRVNILFILVYLRYFTSIFTIDSKISTFINVYILTYESGWKKTSVRV